MRCARLLTLYFLLSVYLAGPGFATEGKESLAGLEGITVRVEQRGTELRLLGDDQLQLDVEMRLLTAGIPLLNRGEQAEGPVLNALLTLLPNPTASDAHSYVGSILLAVNQTATLQQNRMETRVVTWHVQRLFVGRVGFVRENLREVIDLFISDYLAMNNGMRQVG